MREEATGLGLSIELAIAAKHQYCREQEAVVVRLRERLAELQIDLAKEGAWLEVLRLHAAAGGVEMATQIGLLSQQVFFSSFLLKTRVFLLCFSWWIPLAAG